MRHRHSPDPWGRFMIHKGSGRDQSEFECLLAVSDLRIGDLAFELKATPPEGRVP